MKNNKFIWLDDLRDPFVSNWLVEYAPEYFNYLENIIWIKNYNDFKKWITVNGLPHKIAFDFDLGEDIAKELVSKGMNKKLARMKKKESKNGLDCAKWLVQYCISKNLNLPLWIIQSANDFGKKEIQIYLRDFEFSKKNQHKI